MRVPSTHSEVLAAAKEFSLSGEPPPKKPSHLMITAPAEVDVKTIYLQGGDPFKTAMIGTELIDK